MEISFGLKLTFFNAILNLQSIQMSVPTTEDWKIPTQILKNFIFLFSGLNNDYNLAKKPN